MLLCCKVLQQPTKGKKSLVSYFKQCYSENLSKSPCCDKFRLPQLPLLKEKLTISSLCATYEICKSRWATQELDKFTDVFKIGTAL